MLMRVRNAAARRRCYRALPICRRCRYYVAAPPGAVQHGATATRASVPRRGKRHGAIRAERAMCCRCYCRGNVRAGSAAKDAMLKPLNTRMALIVLRAKGVHVDMPRRTHRADALFDVLIRAALRRAPSLPWCRQRYVHAAATR